MMGYQRARIELKRAALSTDFGMDLASRWFGRMPEGLKAEFGVYLSGPRKGSCRGEVIWIKVHEGGWVHGYGVVRPGLRVGAIVDNAASAKMQNGPASEALRYLPSLPEFAFGIKVADAVKGEPPSEAKVGAA